MLRKRYIVQKLFSEESKTYRCIKVIYTKSRLWWYVFHTNIDIKRFEIKSKYGVPCFEGIEIETINKCNGRCSFCPVNIYSDIRKKTVMSQVIYKKIINELAEMEYSGTIAFHSNNEPLLDSRIFDFIEYARIKCERATLFMYTNGTLLTQDKLLRLLKSLDFLIVDWYVDDINKDCSEIFSVWKNTLIDDNIPPDKLKIKLRKRNEVLSSRGGRSPNCSLELSKNKIPCYEPYGTMVIRPDGKISMCKCDAYGETTLGDVNKQSLLEIWNSEVYWNLRKTVKYGRNHERCRQCNFPVY